MAKKNAIIMSWGSCKIEVARISSSQTMPNVLVDIGVINDKSTTLSTEDGEALTATATGGRVVAIEDAEPTVTLTCRVKEASFDMEQMFTGAEVSKDGLTVNTNIVQGEFAVKLTPHNVGSIGIRARRTRVSFRYGSSEDEGGYVDLTFTILPCNDGELYTKFRVANKHLTQLANRLYTSSSAAFLSTSGSGQYFRFLN